MKTIHKYTLDLTDIQRIATHKDAVPLRVQIQKKAGDLANPLQIALWMRVDSAAPEVQREVVIVGTGQEIPRFAADEHYVDTVQCGGFVAHVYVLP